MFPYFLLLILPPLYTILNYAYKHQHNIETGDIGDKKQNPEMLIFFGWLLLLLVCRDETIGRDLPNYKTIWNYSSDGLKYVFSSFSEVLFRLYNWLLYQCTNNYHIYLAITAILTIIPIAYTYTQNKNHSYLTIVLFVNMSTFIMLFSGIRQALAMAVGAVAYQFVKKKKITPFIIAAFAAFLIHHSGFMVFFMYPLYHFKIKRKTIPLLVFPFGIVLLFNKPIFELLVNLLKANEKYDTVISQTNAYGSLILFVLFAVFVYAITDRMQCDEETLGLQNFLIFACFLQCFAPLHSLAMRMNYYYILFIPLAIGKSLSYPRKSMKQVAHLGAMVLCVFFSALFVLTTYQSYVTGSSTLDTIPYKAFWTQGN